MTTDSLLPPSSTPLERALEAAMRPGDDVTDAIDLIRTAKEDPPEDWLLWLVWEYGLDELLPYLTDPSVVLENGLQWQPIRGTPASLHMAFGWIGLQAGIEEEDPNGPHWFEFQLWPRPDGDYTLLDLGDGTGLDMGDGSTLAVAGPQYCYVPTTDELKNMAGLARLSAPVGTRLSRLHNCYDLRRAQWDNFNWSDGSLYSADSGVYNEDLDAMLSFGRTTFCVVDATDTWAPEWASALFHEVAGEGLGRNLLIADGSTSADDAVVARGIRTELPQFPLIHTTRSLAEESMTWGDVGWGDRDWATPETF